MIPNKDRRVSVGNQPQENKLQTFSHDQSHIYTIHKKIQTKQQTEEEGKQTGTVVQRDFAKVDLFNEKAVMRVVEINHQWKKDYNKLQEEYNILKAKLITIERKNEQLEHENKTLHEQLHDNGIVEIDKQEDKIEYSFDDIEALKQQLLIYKEDFMQEKSDLDRVNKENVKLKLELQSARHTIETLSRKNNVYKENFRKIYSEKEHILQELRKLTMLPSSIHTSSSKIPCYHINGGAGSTGNTFTLKPQKYSSSDSLKTEDVIPRCVDSYQFHNGYLERDISPTNIPTKPVARPRSF